MEQLKYITINGQRYSLVSTIDDSATGAQNTWSAQRILQVLSDRLLRVQLKSGVLVLEGCLDTRLSAGALVLEGGFDAGVDQTRRELWIL